MIRQLARVAVLSAALVVVSCGANGTGGEESLSLTDAPQIARWTTIAGIKVPIGKTDGPSTGEWEPYQGFSHTPQGAALAAITQSVQLATASDKTWTKILPGVAAPNEGRDLYATNRAMLTISGTDPEAVPEIVGYTFGDYSESGATVKVVQRFSDDSLASSSTRVVWMDGDWRLDLSAEADAAITALDALPSELVNLEETRK